MTTIIDPTDAALASFTLLRDPDLAETYTPDGGNRVTVTAGGVLAVYDKGPHSEVVALTYTGLDSEELEALRDYIDTVLDGSIEPFRLDFHPRTNLLSETRELTSAVWLNDPSGAFTRTYPSTTLAADGSNTATQMAVLGGSAYNGDWFRQPAYDARGVVSGREYRAALDIIATGSIPAGNLLGVHIRGAGGVIGGGAGIITIAPTASWVTYSKTTTATVTEAGLEWRLSKLGGSFADFTIHVRRPTLQEGDDVDAPHQAVEADTGLTPYRLLSPALNIAEPEVGSFNVSFHLLKTGA